MSETPMNKLDELIAKVIDAGCSCDMMNGYHCGIHAPIVELRAILPDVSRAKGDEMKLDSGATIETYTGLQFHILEPRPEEVNITDIAHALSMQCRFTGHTRFHYSVAQHSYLASFLVPRQFQLEALLHDASEAYIGDMSRPLKHFSECGRLYLEIEAKIEAVIKKKFGLPLTMSPEVKEADNSLLYAEKKALMKPCDWTDTWGKYKEIDVEIESWEPRYAEAQFLRRYNQLWTIVT